jgi:perosamine synthetase
MIRLNVPAIDEDDLEAVREALLSGYLVQGPLVAAFEQRLSAVVGTKHAVAVSNCTSALYLALLALGVDQDDICLVTAYSWVSTANAIEWCGARPVFVDIDSSTYNIDPDQLEKELVRLMASPHTSKRVKAVLPVHTFGQMSNMLALKEICGRWNIPIIEDAACALGAEWQGQKAGSWGVMGCFSFHARKSITTGEGGAVTTDDDTFARRLRALRNHGIDPNLPQQDFFMLGHNYRLTEFQAALGRSQLEKLQRINQARKAAAARYDRLLADTPLQAPRVTSNATHVYQSYVVLLPPDQAPRRAEIIRRSKDAGVEAQIGTIHMPNTTYYRQRYGHRSSDFPATDDVARRALALPLYDRITPEQQQTVVTTVLGLL